jgi:hypothetical protein
MMDTEVFQAKLAELKGKSAPLPLTSWEANLAALELRKRGLSYGAISKVMELYHGHRLSERGWHARCRRAGSPPRHAAQSIHNLKARS